jgi:hypothetical protein
MGKKNVVQAIPIDSDHHQTGLNFLRAQIYDTQADLAGATVQIQQFLKFSDSRQYEDSAREYLSELQSKLNAR